MGVIKEEAKSKSDHWNILHSGGYELGCRRNYRKCNHQRAKIAQSMAKCGHHGCPFYNGEHLDCCRDLPLKEYIRAKTSAHCHYSKDVMNRNWTIPANAQDEQIQCHYSILQFRWFNQVHKKSNKGQEMNETDVSDNERQQIDFFEQEWRDSKHDKHFINGEAHMPQWEVWVDQRCMIFWSTHKY